MDHYAKTGEQPQLVAAPVSDSGGSSLCHSGTGTNSSFLSSRWAHHPYRRISIFWLATGFIIGNEMCSVFPLFEPSTTHVHVVHRQHSSCCDAHPHQIVWSQQAFNAVSVHSISKKMLFPKRPAIRLKVTRLRPNLA